MTQRIPWLEHISQSLSLSVRHLTTVSTLCSSLAEEMIRIFGWFSRNTFGYTPTVTEGHFDRPGWVVWACSEGFLLTLHPRAWLCPTQPGRFGSGCFVKYEDTFVLIKPDFHACTPCTYPHDYHASWWVIVALRVSLNLSFELLPLRRFHWIRDIVTDQPT